MSSQAGHLISTGLCMIYLRVLPLSDGTFQSVLVELAPGSRRLLVPFPETLNQDEYSFELGALYRDANASMWETCVVWGFFPMRLGKKDEEKKDFSLHFCRWRHSAKGR